MSSPAGQQAAACTRCLHPLPVPAGREHWQTADMGPCGASICPQPSTRELPPEPVGVPVSPQRCERPVPSVPTARCGPGVCVALHVTPFCTDLPVFASPVGIAAVFALPLQLRAGAAEAGGATGCCPPLMRRVCCTLGCSARSPWPCGRTPAFYTDLPRAISSPVCVQNCSALGTHTGAAPLPSSASYAFSQSVLVMDFAPVN